VKRYVADTQCIVWYLNQDRRLPRVAQAVFKAAESGRAQILIPSIALVEAIFLLQRERIPESVVSRLMALSENIDATLCVVPLDMAVVRAAKDFGPAAVPEMPDRIIAATARALDVPLLTTDPAIAESGLVKVVE
jgi:predicted nucleic acid-binding protein